MYMIKDQKFLRMYNAQQSLPKFNMRYPTVKSCTIVYTRMADSPGGNISDPHEQVKYVNLSGSSFVTIECYNTDCTKGYFDLHGIIDEMVDHHEESREGEMYCDGYLEKYSANQCLCKLIYIIKIEYV